MNPTLTRREFSRRALASAGAILAAPAFLRGQNLNDKLNIAIIGSGGRGAGESRERGLGEHRRPLRT